MLVKAGFLLADPGNAVILILLGVERRCFQESHWLIEDGVIAGNGDVVMDRVRKPEVVVGKTRAHPGAAGGVPPVLHVASAELPAGRVQDVRASLRGRGVKQRQDILKL